MCMRPTPGCGTLGSPSLSLVLPVSLLLNREDLQEVTVQGCSCKERKTRARQAPKSAAEADADI